jgi:hypothetical protein
MGVDVAGGLRHARHIEPLIMEGLLVGKLALAEHVFEPPDLGDGSEIESLLGGPPAHGAHEIPLEHRQPPSSSGPISMSCPVW